MKKIHTKGITYLQTLEGTDKWYWGTDFIHGDLYEAEELFKNRGEIKGNTLLFVSYPSGKITEPIKAQKGQYFGKPIYYENHIIIFLVDFCNGLMRLEKYDEALCETSTIVSIPLSEVTDCYNLMPNLYPLMLTRHGSEDIFEIIYPFRAKFPIGSNESFYFKKGEQLYFSAWVEDEEYREEIIVRDMISGEIIKRIDGSLMAMPDGQIWLLN